MFVEQIFCHESLFDLFNLSVWFSLLFPADLKGEALIAEHMMDFE